MLAVNAVAAGTCLVLTFVSVYLVQSVFSVMASMALVITARSFFSEAYMNRTLGVPASRMRAFELGLTVEFVSVAFLQPAVSAFCIYTASYTVFLVFFRRELVRAIRKLRL